MRVLMLTLTLAGAGLAAFAAAPPAPVPAEVRRLIAELGKEDGRVRSAAAAKLEAMGEWVLPALRRAAAGDADADVRLRAAVVARAILKRLYGEVRPFAGPHSHVQGVAFVPGGRHVLSGSDDACLHLWDARTGKEERRFAGHVARVLGVAASPDGTQALTSGEDRTVRLWDLKTGKEVRRFLGHGDWVLWVAFSPDGTQALSCSGGYWDGVWRTRADCTARLWDVSTGKELHRLAGHTRMVFHVTFSKDGRRAATSSGDGTVRLWDLRTGKEVRRFAGHAGAVFRAAFSGDGRRLLSAGEDGTLRLWDVATGKERRRLRADTGAVTAGALAGGFSGLALAPDGRRALATSWGDRAVRLWDLEAGREVHRWVLEAPPTAVAFSPDGRRAVTGDHAGRLRLWRLGQEALAAGGK
jgi:WD40 repeat protein